MRVEDIGAEDLARASRIGVAVASSTGDGYRLELKLDGDVVATTFAPTIEAVADLSYELTVQGLALARAIFDGQVRAMTEYNGTLKPPLELVQPPAPEEVTQDANL